jgi:D-lactate dehydrogenase (cytochrome)
MLKSSLKQFFKKNNYKSVVLQQQKRLYTSGSTTPRNYAPSVIGITAAVAAAAGTGYWTGTQQQNKIQQPPQVPIPSIPSHATILKAFQELVEILPQEHVTVDEECLENHGYSNNSYHNEGAPNIVVYPTSTEQVAEIVKIANKYNLPIIPFSGGTSLEGHFSAPKGGICLSFTEHMDRILAFHPEDMDIVVQPGVQWEDLNLYLKKHDLFYPLDPGPGYSIYILLVFDVYLNFLL